MLWTNLEKFNKEQKRVFQLMFHNVGNMQMQQNFKFALKTGKVRQAYIVQDVWWKREDYEEWIKPTLSV